MRDELFNTIINEMQKQINYFKKYGYFTEEVLYNYRGKISKMFFLKDKAELYFYNLQFKKLYNDVVYDYKNNKTDVDCALIIVSLYDELAKQINKMPSASYIIQKALLKNHELFYDR